MIMPARIPTLPDPDRRVSLARVALVALGLVPTGAVAGELPQPVAVVE
jgi:hypothetical protein